MLNLLPLNELKVVSSVDGDLRYAHGCTSQAKPFWWSCQMVLYRLWRWPRVFSCRSVFGLGPDFYRPLLLFSVQAFPERLTPH